MTKVAIVGGETHIAEITDLRGTALEIVGAAVRPDQSDWAAEHFGCPVEAEIGVLLETSKPDVVAVANENDLKAGTILVAFEAGCDVIADKPLAIAMEEQERIEAFLERHPERRLLNLLTLRGMPPWAALRDVLRRGEIGEPAFTHLRMAVRLKRAERPPWFLDVGRSGGLFLDLLIHGLDQIEWITGRRIVAVTANTGNLGFPDETNLRDHAAVYCELDDGSSAVAEGQRMLPDTKSSDYRVLVAGTKGYADLDQSEGSVLVTSAAGCEQRLDELPEPVSIVKDWLSGGNLVSQAASLRANRLAILATMSANSGQRLKVGE